ncbi:MAG: hypothetical protein ACX94A_06680 [Algiphilus sp.]
MTGCELPEMLEAALLQIAAAPIASLSPDGNRDTDLGQQVSTNLVGLLAVLQRPWIR